MAPSSGSSYFDEIWASVPAERAPDGAAVAWALATVESAGVRPQVLDLGCGDGLVTAALATVGAAATGLDPSEVALSRARAAHPELRFVAPAEDGSLPFADGAFDVVVCLHVLEHVPDTQRLMSEARRVLAPGGRIAIAVPFNGRIAGAWSALTAFERIHDPLEPTAAVLHAPVAGGAARLVRLRSGRAVPRAAACRCSGGTLLARGRR